VLDVRSRIRVVWIDKQPDRLVDDEFIQQLKLLGRERIEQHGYAGQVAARAVEALHEAKSGRINRKPEHDRNRRGCRLGRKRGRQSGGRDDIDLTSNQIGGQTGQPIVNAGTPPERNGEMAPLAELLVGKTLPHGSDDAGFRSFVLAAEVADDGRRLCAADQRPKTDDGSERQT